MKSKRIRRIEALARLERYPLNAPEQDTRSLLTRPFSRKKTGKRRTQEQRDAEAATLRKLIGV